LPELPEVETVVRSLAPRVLGRRISTAINWNGPAIGQEIQGLRRHGKYIVFTLERGYLLVHLRMTGKLLWNGARTPYTRAELWLDDGSVLRYDDVRRFGRVTWSEELPSQGPDPLEIEAEEFAARVRARKGRIKPLLLDQKFLRGLGNIYVDEALFRARIHPRAVATKLSPARALILWRVTRELLDEAIAWGGSSISDYVDGEGKRGQFQERHQVYGKAGEPCPRCGAAIRRIVLAQRGTHYCPRCQRA
jgi:formamidopyrimidine-DNA glycosylase